MDVKSKIVCKTCLERVVTTRSRRGNIICTRCNGIVM